MATYTLHFAGSTFELPSAKDSVELRDKIESVQQRGLGARIPVKTVTGTVLIFVSAQTPVAISVDGADTDADGIGG